MKTDSQTAIRLFVMIGVAVALFLRSPELVCSPTFWSEDGVVFFKDAYENGIASIFHPYAGYLHVVTRLCAWASVSLFPLEITPMAFSVFSVAAVFFVAHEYLSEQSLPPLARVVGALAIVMVPHGGEVHFTLTNIHWILSALYPLLILEKPFTDKTRLTRRCVLLLFLGLNDPHVIFVFPFFCLRLYRMKRDKKEWIYFAVSLMCCLVQGAVIALSHRAGTGIESDLTLFESVKFWLLGLIAQPIAIFFGGIALAKKALASATVCVIGTCWAVAMMCLFIVMWAKTSKSIRRLSLLFLMIAVFFFLSSTYRFFKCPDCIVKFGASRYFYLPFVFWAVSIALCISDGRDSLLRRFCGILVLGSVVVGSLTSYRVPARFSLHWKARMSELHEKGRTVMPVSPGDEWMLVLEGR